MAMIDGVIEKVKTHWGPDQAGKQAKWKRTPRQKSAYQQAVVIQQGLYKLVQAAIDNPQELSKLVPLWYGVEDRRQVLAGHGKPKPVQARNEPGRKRTKRSTAGMIDPSTVPAHEVAQSVAQASTGTVPTQAGIDSTGPDAQDLQSHDGVWQG